jgi:Domain found in Dishevelled, Egl-10, and Pleckstrin (DEP)
MGSDAIDKKRLSLERKLTLARGGTNVAAKRTSRWDLRAVSDQMRTQICVKDRKLLMKVQPMCFLGNEAVSYLTATGIVENEAEAIELGNAMAAQGLIAEVAQEHAFRDKPYLYRFAEDEFERLGGGRLKQHSSAMPYEELLQQAGRMHKEMGAGEREHKGRSVPRSFVGEAAVAWMLQTGLARTEVEATGQFAKVYPCVYQV